VGFDQVFLNHPHRQKGSGANRSNQTEVCLIMFVGGRTFRGYRIDVKHTSPLSSTVYVRESAPELSLFSGANNKNLSNPAQKEIGSMAHLLSEHFGENCAGVFLDLMAGSGACNTSIFMYMIRSYLQAT
jgi:hypothetical protein